MADSDPSTREFEAAAVLRQALRDFDVRTEELTRANGLTTEQYQLLLLIKVSPPERATVGHLCDSLRRGQSAVTQLTRRAENRGLIRRELSTVDARIRYLRLTPKGERQLTDAMAALGEERAELARLLSRLPS